MSLSSDNELDIGIVADGSMGRTLVTRARSRTQEALAGHSEIRRIRARSSAHFFARPLPCEKRPRNYGPIKVHELFPRVS